MNTDTSAIGISKLHALPGMGADRRMFPAPWNRLAGFVAHDWPAHEGEVTLTQIAESVCTKAGIHDGDSLIGTSLGGMVATEITRLRKIRSLYLVASAVHPHEINALLRALRPLAARAPTEWLSQSAGSIPHELARMFASVDPKFVRAACLAMLAWNGCTPLAARLFRIHGRRDWVIPASHDCDLLIDGGHLIAMTHAEECVAFIEVAETARMPRTR